MLYCRMVDTCLAALRIAVRPIEISMAGCGVLTRRRGLFGTDIVWWGKRLGGAGTFGGQIGANSNHKQQIG